MEKLSKTNAMRILDRMKIHYEAKSYPVDENDLSGEHLARQLNLNPEHVFKTLLLRGNQTEYLVACIPVSETLDLKKAAKISKNKSVEMVPVKDLFAITGYLRGGCSPIGMKKKFPTFFHNSIQTLASDSKFIYLSAGKRGLQLILSPVDAVAATQAVISDLILR